MRHDNDVNAVTTVRAKAANFVRAHLATPRRAVTYGLLAAVCTGGVALATGPAAAHAAAPTTTTAATATGHGAATGHAVQAAASKHRTASKELRVSTSPNPTTTGAAPPPPATP